MLICALLNKFAVRISAVDPQMALPRLYLELAEFKPDALCSSTWANNCSNQLLGEWRKCSVEIEKKLNIYVIENNLRRGEGESKLTLTVNSAKSNELFTIASSCNWGNSSGQQINREVTKTKERQQWSNKVRIKWQSLCERSKLMGNIIHPREGNSITPLTRNEDEQLNGQATRLPNYSART